MFSTGKSPRRSAVVRLNDAAVRLARLRFVARWLASPSPRSQPPTPDHRWESPWEAPRAGGFWSLGFHGLEHWYGRPFRWSEPVAMLDVPVAAGLHEMSIEWLPVRPVEDLGIYVNGAPRPVTLGVDRAVARFRQPSPGWVRLAWACAPWPAPGDNRFLGLPVHRVSWTA